MRRHFFILLIIFTTPFLAFAQDDSLSVTQLDTLVVDSLEVAQAEEELMYKEDTADFVFHYLPAGATGSRNFFLFQEQRFVVLKDLISEDLQHMYPLVEQVFQN